jgi:catalase-peroxidase
MRTIRIIPLSLLVVASCGGEKRATSDEAPITTSKPVETEAVKQATAPAHPPGPKQNSFWWPKQVDLAPLRDHGPESSPQRGFDYATEFATLDLAQIKKEIEAVLTTSQEWWPADYGNYGPFFIRMAWHSAGTYRIFDGRGGAAGGQQRFEPLNSWPDNASLDKARRLVWPIKQKYGRKISWADLMVLAGNVAMEQMGFATLGFAGGREDDWEAEIVDWGPENTWLDGKQRYKPERQLQKPLAAVQMGLIYVNPEGPNGEPDPLKAAKDIREAFGRMAMNDEETAALIAGGHTFGKAHGAHAPAKCVDVEPGAAGLEEQGFGWKNKCGTGKGADTVTSGLEGAWTSAPAQWTHEYLKNLYRFEWKQTKSPAGATQWIPTDESAAMLVPDAHDKTKRHAPIMFTTDLALRQDPEFAKITKKWLEDPKAFEAAFAKAWFKLTHRDLGPRSRYLGKEVPAEELIWQDPVPAVDHALVTAADIAKLEKDVLASGLTVPELVRVAWGAASSYRATDSRGGANGGRIRLAPQKDWAVNNPAEVTKVLTKLGEIKTAFDKGGKKISLADLVVLAGTAAVKKAATDAGAKLDITFSPGRTDATDAQTDAASFAVLEPKADGFRNYLDPEALTSWGRDRSPSELLVDKADQLALGVPEMAVLVAGLRAIGANAGNSTHGVFTAKPGALSNDFFVNLLDMNTVWAPSGTPYEFVGKDRKSGAPKWTATEVDLVFGSNAELRAIAEFYASADAKDQFVKDFGAAWTKVMNLDRFDLKRRPAK